MKGQSPGLHVPHGEATSALALIMGLAWLAGTDSSGSSQAGLEVFTLAVTVVSALLGLSEVDVIMVMLQAREKVLWNRAPQFPFRCGMGSGNFSMSEAVFPKVRMTLQLPLLEGLYGAIPDLCGGRRGQPFPLW